MQSNEGILMHQCDPECANTRISLCTCERWQKTAALGGCFRHPFHQSSTRRLAALTIFWGSSAPSAQGASNADRCSPFLTSTLTHPPPSSEGSILGPRALSQKWTSVHLPCASWLAVYIGPYHQPAFALASLFIVAL
jgi:hypothetical protein